MQKIVKAMREKCGVHFSFWQSQTEHGQGENGKTMTTACCNMLCPTGKLSWTSLMGPAKKMVLKRLPVKALLDGAGAGTGAAREADRSAEYEREFRVSTL